MQKKFHFLSARAHFFITSGNNAELLLLLDSRIKIDLLTYLSNFPCCCYLQYTHTKTFISRNFTRNHSVKEVNSLWSTLEKGTKNLKVIPIAFCLTRKKAKSTPKQLSK